LSVTKRSSSRAITSETQSTHSNWQLLTRAAPFLLLSPPAVEAATVEATDEGGVGVESSPRWCSPEGPEGREARPEGSETGRASERSTENGWRVAASAEAERARAGAAAAEESAERVGEGMGEGVGERAGEMVGVGSVARASMFATSWVEGSSERVDDAALPRRSDALSPSSVEFKDSAVVEKGRGVASSEGEELGVLLPRPSATAERCPTPPLLVRGTTGAGAAGGVSCCRISSSSLASLSSDSTRASCRQRAEICSRMVESAAPLDTPYGRT